MERESIYRFFPELNWLKDQQLKEKCADTWLEAIALGRWEEKGGFEKLPVVVSGLSKNCPETNVSHTRTVCRIAVAMFDDLAENYPGAGSCDRDTVIAGAILHDVGKLLEYDCVDGTYCFAPNHLKFNHPSIGAYLAQKNGLPEDVVHIILAHSDLMSPGGEKCYQTRESLMVKYADCMAFFYNLKFYGNQ